MFLKQEKPEIYDFKEEKNLVSIGKMRIKNWKMSKFLTDTLAQISQNIFAYSFVSEHS